MLLQSNLLPKEKRSMSVVEPPHRWRKKLLLSSKSTKVKAAPCLEGYPVVIGLAQWNRFPSRTIPLWMKRHTQVSRLINVIINTDKFFINRRYIHIIILSSTMPAGLWVWLLFSTEAPHHLCRWSLWKEGVIIYPSSITSVTISLLSFSFSTIQCTAFDENITENLDVCAIYEEIILDVFHYNDTHS